MTLQIKGLMIVASPLKCAMLHPAIAPEAALTSTFGERIDRPVAAMVVMDSPAGSAIPVAA
jgi:hypothetical protein